MKVYFRSFDLFQFPFDNKRPACLTYSVRVLTRGLSASRLARLSVLLQGLLSKSFLGIKLTTNTNHQFHDFFAFCCRHANRYHVGWIETLILFKICIAITILEFIPKTKTFQELFNLSRSPLHYFPTQPYASLWPALFR